MSKTNSIVEVNGNRYDAISGELISTVKKISANISRPSGKKMVDGFVLPSRKKSTNVHKTATTPAHPKVVAGGLHTGSQKSSTLMRRAVKKPSTLKIVETSKHPHARDSSVNPVRQSRAKTVTRHAAVNRFGFLRGSSASQAVVPPVAATTKTTLKNSKASNSGDVSAPRAPSMITSVSHQKLERLLDEALFKASAHKQMMNGGRRSKFMRAKRLPKWLGVSLVLFVLAAIAAFLVWQNLPSVAVHVAAARAHVTASMPGYTPSGYSFVKPIRYSNGSLTMQYVDKNHAGDGFSLTQKTSDWDSASLAANAVPKDAAVQTSLVNGTTVYIYGAANNATWVNHGTLYSLQNKANLSSDQVMKIVQSL